MMEPNFYNFRLSRKHRALSEAVAHQLKWFCAGLPREMLIDRGKEIVW